MSDFLKWLYPHYIKPYLNSAPQNDYEFWASLLDYTLDPNFRDALDKTLEFTAIQAFLLGLRTDEGLAPFTPR